ncbi:DNA polymerase III subunit delta' [Mesomycoplasma ovipneumoniae]|uniref:DNA polymerase III subunit delta' n=1 Tax=Mesomycoplasma ovipneumoniae TaxID=29562 RepID=UPI00311AFCF3
MKQITTNWRHFLDNLSKTKTIPHAILLVSSYSDFLDEKIAEFLEIFSQKPQIFQHDFSDNRLSKTEFLEEVNKLYFSSLYGDNSKIFLIKNIENAHISVLNSFLKILEDPPLNTYFLLTSFSSDLIIPTIVSRCQIFFFNDLNRKNELKKKLDTWKKSSYNAIYANIFKNFDQATLAIKAISDSDLDKLKSLLNNLTKSKFDFLLFLNQVLTKENSFIFLQIIIAHFKQFFLSKSGLNKKDAKKGSFFDLNSEKMVKINQTFKKFLSSLETNANFNIQKSSFLVRLNNILT